LNSGRTPSKKTVAEAILEMLRLTGQGLTLDDVLQKTAQFLLSAFAVDEAALFLYDADRRSVTPAAVASADGSPVIGEKIALRLSESSAFSSALRSPEVVTLTPSGLRHEILDLSRFRRAHLVRMGSDDGVLGVIFLGIKRGRRRVLGRRASAMFVAVADQAAVIISKTRLFHTLRESEGKYRLLTENASDIVFSLDASGRFTFLNSRVFDILGYTPDELVGQYFSEVVSPASWEATRAALKFCLDSGRSQASYEWVATSRTGAEVLLDVRASIMMSEGAFAGQQGIARDITEQRRLEQEIRLSRQRQIELRDYLALITRVQEEERKRVARELHDDTAQALVVLSRQMEMCVGFIREDPDEACRRLEKLTRLVDSTLVNLRRFTRDLRPPVLDDLGLIPALEWLLGEMQEQYPIKGSLTVRGTARRLPSEIELAMFRIAQEALNNVKKHSRAASASVLVEYGDDRVTLKVADDGVGFDALEKTSRLASQGRLGLIGMNERAQFIGATLTVSSSPGIGTTVELDVPLRDCGA